nr:restriction endonuclease [uncultured Pseudomonas sp.]
MGKSAHCLGQLAHSSSYCQHSARISQGLASDGAVSCRPAHAHFRLFRTVRVACGIRDRRHWLCACQGRTQEAARKRGERERAGQTIEGISWREFELLVGETFRRKGGTVIEKGGSGPDGGVDLVLHLGTDKYLFSASSGKPSVLASR